MFPFYRLYKSSIKDHFYTIDSLERVSAINTQGFNFERIEGFISLTNFVGSIPLYRLYKSGADIHYYTTSSTELENKKTAGYTHERTYYIYKTQLEWTTPLYYASSSANTDNFYTTSKYEYDNAVTKLSFTGNGVIGYVATRVANNRPQGDFAGVGMAVGNLSLPSFTDLSLSGVGPQLSFSRYYDSRGEESSLGNGWSFNYDSYINRDATDGSLHVAWGNGSESHFYSSLTPYPGYFEKIAVNGNGYNITTKDQTVYVFVQYPAVTNGPNILLDSITDKFNNTLKLTRFGTFGLVTKATDATGRTFDFQYMTFGITRGTETVNVQRLQQVTDNSLTPATRVVKFSYNGTTGNLADVTDARNNITTYTYNADGLLATIKYPENNTVTVNYDDLQRVTSYTAGVSPNQITLSFDYQGGTTGTTVKNAATNAILANFQHTDYRAIKTSVRDNTNSANLSVSQPSYCNSTTLANKVCSVIDGNGKTSSFTYDANGNMLTATNALGETTTFTYDLSNNNLLSLKDQRNNTTTYTYDSTNGNKTLKSVQKPMGGVTTYSGYIANGLVGTVTDPTGHYITYTYGDTRHYLPTKIADSALSTSIDYTYDGAGRRQTQTDQQRPTSQLTTWVYDNNDNVTSVQINTNPAAVFRYDKNNRLYNVVDPKGKTTVYTYNTANLLATQQSPDLKTWTYSYDSVGNLSSVALPGSNTVSYLYYPNNRLNKIRYNGADKITYTYDNNGNVTSVADADGGGTTSFLYNNANRVTRIVNPFGSMFDYGYDAAGNRTSITYPGSKIVNYTFDADNRLSTVKDWLGAATTTYNYNTAGILQYITNANGSSTTFTYDNANRLKTLANKKANLTVISDYSLTLDNVGNHSSIIRNEPLAPPVPSATDITYGYNDAHQIQSAGSVTYSHDALGNLQSASNGRSFAFDYANRLTGATVGADIFGFVYDAFGNRISRTKNGTQTRYLLDLNAGMSNVLAETDSVGVVQNYYIHGLGLISRINNAGQRFTYHYDQLGNTVAVTDESNVVAEKYAYDEFGAVLASESTVANPFRYVGKYGVMDEGNGLLHMRARYYDTDSGRFLSRDPLGFEGGDLNLYGYVGGNPLGGVDPEGLSMSPNRQLNKIKKTGTMNKIISDIEKSDVAVKIVTAKSNSCTISNSDPDPKKNEIIITIPDGEGCMFNGELIPTSAVLAHELGHAITDINNHSQKADTAYSVNNKQKYSIVNESIAVYYENLMRKYFRMQGRTIYDGDTKVFRPHQ